MRVRTLPLLALLAACVGCASSGSGESQTPIPVYRVASNVPCAYEVLAPLRHQMTVIVRSGDEYDRIEERELARLGVEEGADAVLIPSREDDRPLRITIETPMTAYFMGDALRYTDAACRRANAESGEGGR